MFDPSHGTSQSVPGTARRGGGGMTIELRKARADGLLSPALSSLGEEREKQQPPSTNFLVQWRWPEHRTPNLERPYGPFLPSSSGGGSAGFESAMRASNSDLGMYRRKASMQSSSK